MREAVGYLDRHDPQGYEVGRFMVVYEMLFPHSEENPADAWEGKFARSDVRLAASDYDYWVQKAMLREAMDIVDWRDSGEEDEEQKELPAAAFARLSGLRQRPRHRGAIPPRSRWLSDPLLTALFEPFGQVTPVRIGH
jgi:hypothetical protein